MGSLLHLKFYIVSQKFRGLRQLRKKFFFWDPELIVVGFPSHFNGSIHPFANNCKRFARNISFETGKEVRLVDESYTSVLSKGKDQDDARAAALILQVVLDELFYANK